MNKIILRSLVSLSLAGFSSCAFAGGAVTGGATFPEQIVQEMTAGDQLAKQAEEVENQINMLKNEALNLAKLPQNYFSQLSNLTQNLSQIVSEGSALSYAGQNINSQFTSEYPGATSALNNYSKDYSQWNTTTNDDITNALQAQHLIAGQFATESSVVSSALSSSQNASGRMAVLQAANQIAAIEAKNTQHLEQITMADDDAQMAYIKQKKAKANATNAMVANTILAPLSTTDLP